MPSINNSLSYVVGATGPNALVWWLDPSTDAPVDFTGWTMSATVSNRDGTTAFTPSSVIKQTGTGDGQSSSDVANVVIQWASTGELSTLAAGKYNLTLTATNDTTAMIRKREIIINIT